MTTSLMQMNGHQVQQTEVSGTRHDNESHAQLDTRQKKREQHSGFQRGPPP